LSSLHEKGSGGLDELTLLRMGANLRLQKFKKMVPVSSEAVASFHRGDDWGLGQFFCHRGRSTICKSLKAHSLFL